MTQRGRERKFPNSSQMPTFEPISHGHEGQRLFFFFFFKAEAAFIDYDLNVCSSLKNNYWSFVCYRLGIVLDLGDFMMSKKDTSFSVS